MRMNGDFPIKADSVIHSVVHLLPVFSAFDILESEGGALGVYGPLSCHEQVFLG